MSEASAVEPPVSRWAAFRGWVKKRRRRIKITFIVVMHVLGALTSIQAVMSTRTPQGSIAWVISLNTCPYVAVPAYWVFGQSKFGGYEFLRHQELFEQSAEAQETLRVLREEEMLVTADTEDGRQQLKLIERLAEMPMTRFNEVDLLVDGQQTFDAIFESIAKAEEYVLVQFYIIRSDGLGNRLKDALLERAAQGVRVYVLYDALAA